MSEKWEDVLRADVEIPQVVEEGMEAAFAQVRAEADGVAEGAVAFPEALRGQQGVQAAATATAPAGRRKRSLLQRPWFAAAAAACAVLVVGGAFAAGTLAGGSAQRDATSVAYTAARTAENAGVDADEGANIDDGYDAVTEAFDDVNADEVEDDAAVTLGNATSSDVAVPMTYMKSSAPASSAGSAKSLDVADSEALDDDADEGDEGDDSGDAGFAKPQGNQKLVYTASVSIETTDFASAKDVLRAKVAESGAIVSSEDESVPGSADAKSATGAAGTAVRTASSRLVMQVRVPADKYDGFVDGLADVGTVISRTSNVENITKTYSETEAEIEALETQKKRLMELLKKADDVADMIEIEDSLESVRSELAAQKNYKEQLDTDVAYSTVTVTLADVSSRLQPSVEPSLPERIAQAFADGGEAFAAALAALLVGIVGAWPFLIVLAAIAVVAVVLVRRYAGKQDADDGGGEAAEPDGADDGTGSDNSSNKDDDDNENEEVGGDDQ